MFKPDITILFAGISLGASISPILSILENKPEIKLDVTQTQAEEISKDSSGGSACHLQDDFNRKLEKHIEKATGKLITFSTNTNCPKP